MSYLAPCPGCGRNRKADEGHHLCRECEGYKPSTCGAGGCTNTNPPQTYAERAKCFYDGSPCQRTEEAHDG